MVDGAGAVQAMGIGVIDIMPNDTKISPGDSFANMKAFAAEHKFPFPYVMDETQDIARSYGAVCTPDFFGFNGKDELQYRGRLDESKTTLVKNARRALYDSITLAPHTRHTPKHQTPPTRCTLKPR